MRYGWGAVKVWFQWPLNGQGAMRQGDGFSANHPARKFQWPLNGQGAMRQEEEENDDSGIHRFNGL